MRRIRTMLFGALGVIGLLGAMTVPAFATGYEEMRLEATVDQVRVNRTGGITMSGTLECNAVVAAAYPSGVPANTTVMASVNWYAYQYVGKNKAITAQYESGIAAICFTNDPDMLEWAGTWRTLYAFPMGTEQWVYSTNGKFTQGPVHVELSVVGVSFVVNDVEYRFYNLGPWDVKAIRVK